MGVGGGGACRGGGGSRLQNTNRSINAHSFKGVPPSRSPTGTSDSELDWKQNWGGGGGEKGVGGGE